MRAWLLTRTAMVGLVACLLASASCRQQTTRATPPTAHSATLRSVALGDVLSGVEGTLYFVLWEASEESPLGTCTVYRSAPPATPHAFYETAHRIQGIAEVGAPAKLAVLATGAGGSELILLSSEGAVIGAYGKLPPLAALAAGRSTSDILALRTGTESYTSTLLLRVSEDGHFQRLLSWDERPFRLVWTPEGKLCQMRLSSDRRHTEVDVIDPYSLSVQNLGRFPGIIWAAEPLADAQHPRLLALRSAGPPGGVIDYLSILDLSSMLLDNKLTGEPGDSLLSVAASWNGRRAAAVRERAGTRELLTVDLETGEPQLLLQDTMLTTPRLMDDILVYFRQSSSSLSLWEWSSDAETPALLWLANPEEGRGQQ